MQLFYAPEINEATHILDKEESLHCIRVLRLREGREVFLTDGRGNWYKSVIMDANPKACVLQIVEKRTDVENQAYRLHIAIAPTKHIDRFEWFLEKATECGISEITPVFCENSERTTIKHERLVKVLISAMKQSLRTNLPLLNQAVKLNRFLQETYGGQGFIAHCAEGQKVAFTEALNAGTNALVLIGPEGDFSADEVAAAGQAGFKAVSLGAHRLRTETAALAACMGFNCVNKLF
jgi:16S rRNA (uracil1498-N3)-methyltransferase